MARAAAPADLQWKLDLAAQSPGRVADRAQDLTRRHVTLLASVAAAVWLLDVLQVVTR